MQYLSIGNNHNKQGSSSQRQNTKRARPSSKYLIDG